MCVTYKKLRNTNNSCSTNSPRATWRQKFAKKRPKKSNQEDIEQGWQTTSSISNKESKFSSVLFHVLCVNVCHATRMLVFFVTQFMMYWWLEARRVGADLRYVCFVTCSVCVCVSCYRNACMGVCCTYQCCLHVTEVCDRFITFSNFYNCIFSNQ